MTTIWDKLAEAVRHLDEPFRRSEIIGWFRRHHPEVNEASLGAHIQGAVHGGSRGQFETRTPLLVRIDHGLYRRYGSDGPSGEPVQAEPARVSAPARGLPDVVLVSCTRSKLPHAAPAAQLYLGAGFAKATAYADQLGLPWYVLSARHGLLSPEDVVGPYDVYLSDRSTAYRAAWGAWVVAQLVDHLGALDGRHVEIHAGEAYATPLRERLRQSGSTVTEPLAGLRQGERLAWYGERLVAEPVTPDHPDPSTAHLLARLRAPDAAMTADQLRQRRDLGRPGVYSWWVDEQGADDLSAGLGHRVRAGLVYAGLAGATRWPSGKHSKNTLYDRLVGMHLGARAELSTFRLSLSAAIGPRVGWEGTDEEALTRWMTRHLRIVAVPYDDADGLGRVEGELLTELDPPLNLRGVPPTALRQRLSQLRGGLR